MRQDDKGFARVFEAKRYAEDIRDRAVAAVMARRVLAPKDRSIFREVALDFGVGEQSLRLWVKKAHKARPPPPDQVSPDAPAAQQAYIGEATEVSELRRQVERLKAENALLKRAFVMFSSEWAELPPEDPDSGG